MTLSNLQKPLVSVIVTTRNEERNIVNCLESIKLQTYSPIEIVVVDNASTDATKVLARKFTEAVVDKGPERSAQRNYGICNFAAGEYAMFIDADMILSPSLIESCVSEIEIRGVIGLHIKEVILGRGTLAKIRRFERGFYSGTVIDGSRFFRRTTFCRLGGFDENLPPGPEDWDLDKRFKLLGRIELLDSEAMQSEWSQADFISERGIVYDPRYVGLYHNEDSQSYAAYLKKKAYYSPSMKSYVNKWGKGDPDLKQQLGFKYRFFTVFLEHKRWKSLARHPILTILMFLLRLGVGAVYLVVRE